MEVSNKQIWDGEEYVFLPLVTELLSIKVMRSAFTRWLYLPRRLKINGAIYAVAGVILTDRRP